MPLADLVHTLNLNCRPLRPGLHLKTPFVFSRRRVFVHYGNLRLESRFLSFVSAATGRFCGHVASLAGMALSSRQALAADAVFNLPADAEELADLDRIVHTLHVLNYLLQPVRGHLILKVLPHHGTSASGDHGLAFDEILRPCGLLPEQITLEIELGSFEDENSLKLAIGNYRSQGYGVAVAAIGRQTVDVELLRFLRPDIVKLEQPRNPGPVKPLVDSLHNLGAMVMVEGTDTSEMRQQVAAGGIDFLLQIPKAVARGRKVQETLTAHADPDQRRGRRSAAWG